jgi:hypothetical protein
LREQFAREAADKKTAVRPPPRQHQALASASIHAASRPHDIAINTSRLCHSPVSAVVTRAVSFSGESVPASAPGKSAAESAESA